MKHIILIWTLLVLATTLNAQHSEQIEKIKAQKVAFITEKLALTPVVAEKFWPVYNEFSSKMDTLNIRRMKHRKDSHTNWESLSAKQKEALVDLQIQHRVDEVNLEKQYHDKFKKVLTIDQVMRLYESEKEFKMRLMKQIRGDHKGQGNGPKR
jgi:hypothetical protein